MHIIQKLSGLAIMAALSAQTAWAGDTVTVELGATTVTLEAPEGFTLINGQLRPPLGKMSSFLFDDHPGSYLPELLATHGSLKSARAYLGSDNRKVVAAHPMTIDGIETLVLETKATQSFGNVRTLNAVIPASPNPVQIAFTMWERDGYDFDIFKAALASIDIEAVRPLNAFEESAFTVETRAPFTLVMADSWAARLKTRPGKVEDTDDPRIDILTDTTDLDIYFDRAMNERFGIDTPEDTPRNRAIRLLYENPAGLYIDADKFKLRDITTIDTANGPAMRVLAQRGKRTLVQYSWPDTIEDDMPVRRVGVAYGKNLDVSAADAVLQSLTLKAAD